MYKILNILWYLECVYFSDKNYREFQYYLHFRCIELFSFQWAPVRYATTVIISFTLCIDITIFYRLHAFAIEIIDSIYKILYIKLTLQSYHLDYSCLYARFAV